MAITPTAKPPDIISIDQGQFLSGVITLTGNVRWHNPLKGFGLGLVTIATGNSGCSANASVLAEKHRRDKQASDSAAVTACS